MKLNKNEQYIVYKSFTESFEANLIKSKLEAFKIECYLIDEFMVNLLNPLSFNLDNGIKLYINKDDLEAVNQILVEDDSNIPEA